MHRLLSLVSALVVATPLAAQGLGTGVALAGENLFVGRPGTIPGFPMPPAAGGTVHVFHAGASGWNEVSAIQPGDGSVGDGFGSAVHAQGTRLLVGAPGGAAAYVYEWRQNRWQQAARLAAPEAQEGDEFGAVVQLIDDWALVAAPGRDGGRGAVFAFQRQGSAWTHATTITAAARDSLDRFGAALALSGSLLYVGAPGPSPLGGIFGGAPPARGRVVVVQGERDGSWREVATLAPADTMVRAFGTALMANDDHLLVGAPASGRGAGAVLRYARTGMAWSEAGRITPGPEARGPHLLGMTLPGFVDGDLVVGAPMAGGAGGALVFRDGVEVARLTSRTQGLIGLVGVAAAAGGTHVVLGAPGADFFEGVAFGFTRHADGTWSDGARIVNSTGGGLAAITGAERRCAEGQAEIFNCQQVSLQAFLPKDQFGAPRGIMMNDLWGWTDPDTRREYALAGLMDRTSFIDITDPANPRVLGWLPMHEGAQANLWRDIKVYRNHAFIVADGAGAHGMQVFDLTRLRDVPGAPVQFTEDAHYANIASAHNIVINEETGFAYSVASSAGGETCGGALHMIDIRDPKHPQFAGCFADPRTGGNNTGQTHDAQCVVYHGPDTAYTGREICFNASETALGIADVTDKANPQAIAIGAYPNVAYTHQGWLSDDHRHFFLNDEGDELAGTVPRTRTIVWDVQDLDDPVVLTEFLGTTSATDHNLYVQGRYMYQSNYVSGLRIIDIGDPANPVEVGYFDTVPWGANAPGFAGTWSNYPYFPSGTIIVSSMREGLFVLKFTPPALVP